MKIREIMRFLNKLSGVVILFLALLFTNFAVFAQENNQKSPEKQSIVVISDRLERANEQYLIYPQVSEMVAAELINELNKEGVFTTTPLSEVREKLRSQKLIRSSNKLLSDYRYTYDLNFGALKKIAKEFNTTNVLLVTGSLDTVSDFLKPTWWNFLNIPGENVVKTEYRLYTYIALVDLKSETITWQNTYHRQITAPEFALANATYSPDYRQLTKIKKSSNVIARDAVYRVESVLVPWFAVDKTPPTVHEMVKFKVNKKYNEYIQNINDKRTEKAKQGKEINAVLKTKQTSDKNSELQLIKNSSSVKIDESVKLPESNTEPVLTPVSKLLPAADLKENETKEMPVSNESSQNIYVSPLNIIIPKM